MSLLTIVLTHLDAAAVDAHVQYVQTLAPSADLVLCHGGRRPDYEGVQFSRKMFLDEPTLRGEAATYQSYNELLTRVYREHMSANPEWTAALLLEFDHLPLRGDYAEQCERALDESGADFLGVDCGPRNDTNWYHYLRLRDDKGLQNFLRDVTTTDEPDRLFGCLGTGFVIRRQALAAFAGLEHYEPCYLELYLPTVIHHLGFKVGDLSSVSDLGRYARWAPVFSVEEAHRARADGAVFIHPYKDYSSLSALTG